jgi:HEAT repeat protein
VRGLLATFVLILLAGHVLAHGGSYRGPGGETPPGLIPGPPPKPDSTGGAYHTWLSWWGWNKFKYFDYRSLQIARRRPTKTGGVENEKPEDPDAWRGEIRAAYTPLMLKAVEDEDDEVRTSAAVALGKWRVKSAIARLKKMRIRDKKKQVRESALLGLILMRDPSLLPFLGHLAMDAREKDRMRGYALLGIGLIDDEISRDLLFAVLDPRNEKARRTLPQSDQKRSELLCAAVAGLAWRKDPAVGNRLLALARDRRILPLVRAYALAAVGKVGAEAPVPAILEILARDKNHHLRRSAAVALGTLGMGDEGVLAALERSLKLDKDRIVRHFSTLSLGRIGGPGAFAILSKSFPLANSEAHSFFLIAFGLCREPAAVTILEKVLERGGNARDRAAAALALGLSKSKESAEKVRTAFTDARDWLLIEATMLSLGLLDDKVSAERIEGILKNTRPPSVRSSAALSYSLLRPWSANRVLTEILRTAKSIITLSNVSQIMGFLPNRDAAGPLVTLYEDEKLQRQARAFALVALGALGDPEPVPILATIAFDLNYMIRADAVDEAATIL